MESTKETELLIRRILDEQENQIRSEMVNEVLLHRQYMQSITKSVAAVISIIILTSGAVFVYFFGPRLDNVVDEKVVEYKIIEQYKSKLSARLDEIISSKEINSKLSNAVKNVANREVLKNLDASVTIAINEEIKKLQSSSGDDTQILLTSIKNNEETLNKIIEILLQELDVPYHINGNRYRLDQFTRTLEKFRELEEKIKSKRP